MLRISNIKISFKRKKVLSKLNFDMPAVGSVKLCGDNGSGKTTLLKILSGYLRSHGKIFWHTKRLSRKSRQQISSFTLVYKQFLNGKNSKIIRDCVNELSDLPLFDNEVLQNNLRELQISDLLTKNISSISEGEFKRLIVALCFAKRAEIYLLDEPYANLDAESVKLVRRIVEEKSQTNLVIYASHDLLNDSDCILNLSQFHPQVLTENKTLDVAPLESKSWRAALRFLHGKNTKSKRLIACFAFAAAVFFSLSAVLAAFTAESIIPPSALKSSKYEDLRSVTEKQQFKTLIPALEKQGVEFFLKGEVEELIYRNVKIASSELTAGLLEAIPIFSAKLVQKEVDSEHFIATSALKKLIESSLDHWRYGYEKNSFQEFKILNLKLSETIVSDDLALYASESNIIGLNRFYAVNEGLYRPTLYTRSGEKFLGEIGAGEAAVRADKYNPDSLEDWCEIGDQIFAVKYYYYYPTFDGSNLLYKLSAQIVGNDVDLTKLFYSEDFFNDSDGPLNIMVKKPADRNLASETFHEKLLNNWKRERTNSAILYLALLTGTIGIFALLTILVSYAWKRSKRFRVIYLASVGYSSFFFKSAIGVLAVACGLAGAFLSIIYLKLANLNCLLSIPVITFLSLLIWILFYQKTPSLAAEPVRHEVSDE